MFREYLNIYLKKNLFVFRDYRRRYPFYLFLKQINIEFRGLIRYERNFNKYWFLLLRKNNCHDKVIINDIII